MNGTIGQRELSQMFQSAAAHIRERHAELSALDSVSGDGDHGATMLRIVDQFDIAALASEPKTILHEAGWKILNVDGGASSSLFGTFFLGMADAPECGGPMNCPALAATFEAGLAAVSKQTQARPGDKTIMDALVPAIASLGVAAHAGKSVVEAIRNAAEAARAGAESTSGLTARFGRAKFLGEKTRGHQDPGAASIALLFEGFSSALAETKGDTANARC
jgi:phosphoenolpyruvate---glycerone phosphotransferase subunit DhaL